MSHLGRYAARVEVREPLCDPVELPLVEAQRTAIKLSDAVCLFGVGVQVLAVQPVEKDCASRLRLALDLPPPGRTSQLSSAPCLRY